MCLINSVIGLDKARRSAALEKHPSRDAAAKYKDVDSALPMFRLTGGSGSNWLSVLLPVATKINRVFHKIPTASEIARISFLAKL
jgi:hypothetical protein